VKRIAAGTMVLLLVALFFTQVQGLPVAEAAITELFFSEYIEGTSFNKALEIFNGTGAPVNLAAGGYNVQMYFNGSASPLRTISLTGTVAAGDVYVLAQASANAAILAQADQTDTNTSWFNGDDAVVLRKGTTIIDVIGQIGVDPGTEWGSGLNSTADNTLRRKPTVQAGDTNGSDAFDPAVQWDGYATDTFDGLGSHTITDGDAAPSVSSTSPTSGATNVAPNANITINFSEPVNVSGAWYSISCAVSGSHAASKSGGPQSFTLNPTTDFAYGETCTVTIVASQVTDQDTNDPPDNMASNHVFSFSTEPLAAEIHDIQGAAHISPLQGRQVVTDGIVTAKASNGFWFQSTSPDSDDATSEGLFVFGTASAGLVVVGDGVQVRGTVTEFRPGGATQPNLTTTELTSPFVTKLTSGNTLPAATVIGSGGRVPPTTVISDDAVGGSVENAGSIFDPANDGIDFYESLEGMRVQINNAVAVGPRNAFGEIALLADDGAGASVGVRTARGGIVIRSNDFNPERIILDDVLTSTPVVKVGDHFTGPVVGVMDYSFGNFKLLITSPLTGVDGGLAREVGRLPTDHEVVVGTYNVENLDPSDGDAAFQRHASLIVNNLRSPDILAIEEIQDNDGATNSIVTDASVTWNMLIAAIKAAGGPDYQFRQIDPLDDQDGGQPGGNIRVGFLFRTDRGVEFIDRPGGTPTTPTLVVRTPSGPQLSASPGRIDPDNSAWFESRKPIAGEFRARGRKLFVIANHWSSKGGDHPLFGRFQPPVLSSEVQRKAQAQVVRSFVDELLDADPNANVIVLGDLNDFEFSPPLTILKGAGTLHTLIETLAQNERYSYVFDGNSQVLDQIVVSQNLFSNFGFVYDVIHVNSEFPDQASDHEPSVARLDLRGRPRP
jgi:predicted extracellular nuclease